MRNQRRQGQGFRCSPPAGHSSGQLAPSWQHQLRRTLSAPASLPAAIVKAVEEGHDVNEVEAAGNTPLHFACYEGWLEGCVAAPRWRHCRATRCRVLLQLLCFTAAAHFL